MKTFRLYNYTVYCIHVASAIAGISFSKFSE